MRGVPRELPRQSVEIGHDIRRAELLHLLAFVIRRWRRKVVTAGRRSPTPRVMRDGNPAPIPADRLYDPRTGFGRLLQRFNAMAAAVAEREALAVPAGWRGEARATRPSRLRHGARGQQPARRNAERGRGVAEAWRRSPGAGHFAEPAGTRTHRHPQRRASGARPYKGSEEPSWLAPADLDDLRFLIRHEVARRRLEIANVRELEVDQPLDITYPDPDSAGVLIKLGRLAENGVGPDQDIVAFSTLCPHKGFGLLYVAEDKSLNCPRSLLALRLRARRHGDLGSSDAEPAAVQAPGR